VFSGTLAVYRDFADLWRVHRDPEVMKTRGGLRSEVQTREYLQVNLDHWERYGLGYGSSARPSTARLSGAARFATLKLRGNLKWSSGTRSYPTIGSAVLLRKYRERC
jgi:hypothetical protein